MARKRKHADLQRALEESQRALDEEKLLRQQAQAALNELQSGREQELNQEGLTSFPSNGRASVISYSVKQVHAEIDNHICCFEQCPPIPVYLFNDVFGTVIDLFNSIQNRTMQMFQGEDRFLGLAVKWQQALLRCTYKNNSKDPPLECDTELYMQQQLFHVLKEICEPLLQSNEMYLVAPQDVADEMDTQFKSKILPDSFTFLKSRIAHTAVSLFEVKLQESPAFIQNGVHYARFVKSRVATKNLIGNMPMMLINSTGNELSVYGALTQRVSPGQPLIYHVQKLGSMFMRTADHERWKINHMADFLSAIYQGHALLIKYYNNAVQNKLTNINVPTKLIPPTETFINDETRHEEQISIMHRFGDPKDMRRFVYTGQLMNNEKSKVCVKLINLCNDDHFNEILTVHRYCSLNKVAPKLIGHKRLWNNWYMLVTEWLSDPYKVLDKELFKNMAVRAAVANILSVLHTPQIVDGIWRKFVHGDFRYANILVAVFENGSVDARLIDFDFAGFEGSAVYPGTFDSDAVPHGGLPRNAVLQAHDLVLVNTETGELVGCPDVSTGSKFEVNRNV